MRLLRAERRIEPSLLGQFELTSKKYTVLRSLISLLRNTPYDSHMRFPADFSALPCRKQNTIFFFSPIRRKMWFDRFDFIRFPNRSFVFPMIVQRVLGTRCTVFMQKRKTVLFWVGCSMDLITQKSARISFHRTSFWRKRASKENLSLFLRTAFTEWQLMIKEIETSGNSDRSLGRDKHSQRWKVTFGKAGKN